jgi:hypothetical protein
MAEKRARDEKSASVLGGSAAVEMKCPERKLYLLSWPCNVSFLF